MHIVQVIPAQRIAKIYLVGVFFGAERIVKIYFTCVSFEVSKGIGNSWEQLLLCISREAQLIQVYP